MGKVSYIVPLHKFDEEVSLLLPNALKSIKETKPNEYAILIVGPKDVLEKVEPIVTDLKLKSATKFVENNGDTDFFSQVNEAALKCTTKFFCVVEFDDMVIEYWPAEFEKYQAAENASIVLPIDELFENGQWVSLANEIMWSNSFADENNLGVLNLDCLNKFMDFNVTGAFINTEDFIKVGALKPSLKFAAWYEFLMRACYNGLKVYVAPKLGYSHSVNRKGSYMDSIAKDISREEGAWLIETAKQEYFFKEDRKKKFGE